MVMQYTFIQNFMLKHFKERERDMCTCVHGLHLTLQNVSFNITPIREITFG